METAIYYSYLLVPFVQLHFILLINFAFLWLQLDGDVFEITKNI